jgi:hypothetical protein
LFAHEGVGKDVIFEHLALYLCVMVGEDLALLAHPADVRAALQVEKGLGMPAEAQVALVFIPFAATEKLPT